MFRRGWTPTGRMKDLHAVHQISPSETACWTVSDLHCWPKIRSRILLQTLNVGASSMVVQMAARELHQLDQIPDNFHLTTLSRLANRFLMNSNGQYVANMGETLMNI